MTNKPSAFSGIQPSGTSLTLGNYLGALQRFVDFQNTHDAIYCVVDLHAITVRQDAQALRENSRKLAAWYIAAGLNPEKCALFLQSHIREHTELSWLLSTFTQMGELERMTQFKDKAARHKNNINAGLFTYPVLMAADILLYQTDEVPVGHDQLQHLELARNVAERFNNAYGVNTFTVPKAVIPKAAARVKDLQEPTKKMSKSELGGGTIFLSDDIKQIEKKIKRAVTDNEARVAWDEENQPGVTNLLGIYAACEGVSPEEATKAFEGQQYGTLKSGVAESVVNKLSPIKARYEELMADIPALDKILTEGANKARPQAAKTVAEVKEIMGFVKG